MDSKVRDLMVALRYDRRVEEAQYRGYPTRSFPGAQLHNGREQGTHQGGDAVADASMLFVFRHGPMLTCFVFISYGAYQS